MKKFFLLFCIVALSFISWKIYQKDPYQSQVIFFDIGQGDASLIKLPTRKKILIDGGPDNLILRRLGEELNFYDKKIDYIIISHWHDDHISGLMQIIKRYKVGTIIYADGLSITPLGRLTLQLAKSKNIPTIALSNQNELFFDKNCSLNIINPYIYKVKRNDNDSLIVIFDCHNMKFLFSGDNEKVIEEAVLASGLDISADVFKASHHGSKSSNQMHFLQAVNPKLLVISVGSNNKFSHPAPETIINALESGIKIWRTDLQGSARFNLE